MAVANSSIEWTDSTWSPLTGCTKVSPGCDHCYAETLHERFNGKGSFATVSLRPDRLDQPLRWTRPRRIFVNSMSDLFHKDVPDEYIAQVFAVMAAADWHQFMQLDHRPTSSERDAETPPGAQGMRRVGKKTAGRELDGRTWDEYPAVQTDVSS